MGKQNRIILKNYFQTGKVPTSDNYSDLIDSYINLEDSDVQIIKGGISSSHLHIGAELGAGHITASGNISASGYVTASQLFGNISADYIQMPFNKNIFLGNPTDTDAGITYSISASGNLRMDGSASFGGDISASGVVSASKFIADSASFSHIEGNSPITFKDPITFQSSSTFTDITASGNIDVAGTIFGTVSSGTGAQTGITSTGTLTKLLVLGPTRLTGSMNIHTEGTGPVSVTGSISMSGNLTVEKNISASIFTAFSASINHITGSISGSLTGKVTASGLSLGGTRITATGTEINYLDGLTSGEATMLKRIDSNDITNTEWSYVANMQNVSDESNPTFAGLSVKSSVTTYTVAYTDHAMASITITGAPSKFQLQVQSMVNIRAKLGGGPSMANQLIRVSHNRITTASNIIISPIKHFITANVINVDENVMYITFENNGIVDFLAAHINFSFLLIN